MNFNHDSFESKRLLFEERKASHASEVYEQFCEKELYLYTMRDVPPSVEWLAEGFRKCESKISDDGKEIWLGWFGRDKISGKIVGLFEASMMGEDAYLAYTIFKPYWGKGLASEGTQAMMDNMKNIYPIKKFILEMDTRNRGSVKVAEKLGFHFIQVKNNAAFVKNFVSHEFVFEKRR